MLSLCRATVEYLVAMKMSAQKDGILKQCFILDLGKKKMKLAHIFRQMQNIYF